MPAATSTSGHIAMTPATAKLFKDREIECATRNRTPGPTSHNAAGCHRSDCSFKCQGRAHLPSRRHCWCAREVRHHGTSLRPEHWCCGAERVSRVHLSTHSLDVTHHQRAAKAGGWRGCEKVPMLLVLVMCVGVELSLHTRHWLDTHSVAIHSTTVQITSTKNN